MEAFLGAFFGVVLGELVSGFLVDRSERATRKRIAAECAHLDQMFARIVSEREPRS